MAKSAGQPEQRRYHRAPGRKAGIAGRAFARVFLARFFCPPKGKKMCHDDQFDGKKYVPLPCRAGDPLCKTLAFLLCW
jgi:hypothetical protein